MELSARVSKNLSLEIKESVISGTSGLVIYTRTKDDSNITIKVPDQVTVVSLNDLQIALNEARRFLGMVVPDGSNEYPIPNEPKVNAVKEVVKTETTPTEVAGVALDFIPSFETDYLGAEGTPAPEFNGN